MMCDLVVQPARAQRDAANAEETPVYWLASYHHCYYLALYAGCQPSHFIQHLAPQR